MNRKALGNKELRLMKEKMESGMFPQWVVTDPEIYELEKEKIFGSTWQFLAHETELKEPGSYVTRWIVDDPVLVVRTNSGEIKAFSNTCSHRGVLLCTTDFGKKKTFTCPYHGWSYNNEGKLIGIVCGDKIYGEEMDKEQWGLRPIPQVAMYQGLIFGTLDPNAMSLEDFLGDLKWYLDIVVGRSGGMEVRGVPHRWVIPANWKSTMENFAGEPYHVQMTHRSTVELGLSPKDPLYASYGHQIVLEHGHSVNVITAAAPGETRPPFQGLPKEMWPLFEENLSKEQLEVYRKATIILGTVFPNLSYHSPVHGSEGSLDNFLTLRVWRPLGPDRLEVWSWFLVDKAAPEELKEAAYKGYISSFGPAGTLEQDDTEIWARIMQASKSKMARDRDLNYNNVLNYFMGVSKAPKDETWPGPGEAYATTYTDAVLRGIHEYWFELISEDFDI